jgi:hypothetical protein
MIFAVGLPRKRRQALQGLVSSYYTIMNRIAVIEQLRETQKTLEKLLLLLGIREQERFASLLYNSRREPASLPTRGQRKQTNRALYCLDVPDRREHGLQGRISPMGAPAADW